MALLRHRLTALLIVVALVGCSTAAPVDDAAPDDRAHQPVDECDAVDADELADHPCGQSDWDDPPPAVGDDSQ